MSLYPEVFHDPGRRPVRRDEVPFRVEVLGREPLPPPHEAREHPVPVWNEGSRDQPKGPNFGFRTKISVSASPEMFRQKLVFWQKEHFRHKGYISAEIAFFRSLLALFRHYFVTYFAQKKVISAEIPSFGFFRLFRLPFGSFLLSAEIVDFKTPSFGFGRYPFG